MVLVLVATLVGAVVRPSAAFAAGCDPADPSTFDTSWANRPRGACINGSVYTTRSRLSPAQGCLRDTPANFEYPDPTYCALSGGVEAIGQARAIRWLSNLLEPGPLISPNVQGEMGLPKGFRPDIFVYNRSNRAAGVEVIGAKLATNRDYADWPLQHYRYITHFSSPPVSMPNVRAGTILTANGYSDTSLIPGHRKLPVARVQWGVGRVERSPLSAGR